MSRTTGDATGFSLADFEDIRRNQRCLTGLAAYIQFDNNLTGHGASQSVKMTFTTPHLFEVLGVGAALGRTFTEAEDQEGGDVRQLVLSHGLWRSYFGGDHRVLGQTVRLRGDTYTVIGVMPPGFRYPDRADVWVPLRARYASYSNAFPFWRARDMRIHSVVARLKPSLDLQSARADLRSVAAALEIEHLDTNKGVTVEAMTLREAEAGNLRSYVLLLLCAALLVLLIAVFNVANLLLARATAREREIAILAALGSSRWRIARGLLAECMILGCAGGVLGAALAVSAIPAFSRFLPESLPAWIEFRIDYRALLFCFVISAFAGVLFGLVPALRLSSPDLSTRLKDGARGSSSRNQSLRSALVVAEVSFSVLLLVGAGLLVRSFLHLQHVETGFRTSRLLSVRVSRFVSGRPHQELAVTYGADHRRLIERFSQLPGVLAVGGSYSVPFEGTRAQRTKAPVFVKGQDDRDRLHLLPAQSSDVTPGFFTAMGIPLVEGRDFLESDSAQSPPVAIVSRSAAQALWPGRNPIGQQLRWGAESELNLWATVVGVVGDTRWNAMETGTHLEVFYCSYQWPIPAMTFFLRTATQPQSLMAQARRIVAEVSPETAVVYNRTMEDIVDESIWQPKVWSAVMALFAALALALAAVGLYGVMSYLVAQRQREIGIRIALGAPWPSVLMMILKQGMTLALLGCACGVGAAVLGANILSSLLHGVNPRDVFTLSVIPLALLAVAFSACVIPAWRASAVDPVIALRSE
jgi:predicted permease